MAPLVSVVLPTYNRASTLPRAVDSVLAQSYTTLELIVVDDGSTDHTREILVGIDDPRLRYLPLGVRSGAATARNAGITAASGGLIAFQDSDDEWLPTKLSAQVSLMEASGPEVGWVGGRHRVILDVDSQEVGPDLVIAGHPHVPELLDGRAFVTPSWLVRRETLQRAGQFRDDMPCLEDWDLIFRLDDVCQFRAVDEIVLIRHASSDSLYGHDPSRVAGMEMILAIHGHRWRDYRADLAARYRDLGAAQYRLGKRGRAFRSYAAAVRLEPWRWQTYLQIALATLR